MKILLPVLIAFIPFLALAQAPAPFLLPNGHYQFVNSATLKPAFEETYAYASPFHDGYALVSKDHQSWLINVIGSPAPAGSFSEFSGYQNGYAETEKAGQHMLIANGKVIYTSPNKLLLWGLSDSYINFIQKESGKMGVVNFKTGQVIIPAAYDHIRTFSGGFTAALQGSSWAFIDVSGNPVSTQRYEDAGSFSENVVAARQGSYWGYVNKDGNWVIPAQYDRVLPFKNGTAFVQKSDNWQQIDLSGTLVRQLPYQMITEPMGGVYAFMQNNLWGYASAESGQVLIIPQYARAAAFQDGLALVVKDGKTFYITPEGKELR